MPMNVQDCIPEDIVAFWFPDGDAPTADEHMRLWNWRMRGGAHAEVITRFSDLTARAAAGDLDHWEAMPMGRLALTIVFDQFTRSIWAGTPRAYAYDERTRDLCLQGLENVWQKAAFMVPLEHCECVDPADHLANLDIAIADRLIAEAPPHLRQAYEFGVGQPRRHRAVIARFGRHPHRNAVLGATARLRNWTTSPRAIFRTPRSLEFRPRTRDTHLPRLTHIFLAARMPTGLDYRPTGAGNDRIAAQKL